MKVELKHIVIGIASMIVLALFAFSATSIFAGKPANTDAQALDTAASATGAASSGDVQVVRMHVEGGQYIFEPKAVVKGKPVRIIADVSRIPGCSKSFTIPEYGIRKYLTPTDNTIEFTPQKAGQLYVACSMNMYRGVLAVSDTSSGLSTAAAAAATSAAQAASTQAKPTGGCGCGGGGCGG